MANFVKRLNFKSDGHLVANELIEITLENRTHTLLHHNVMQENGITVRTGVDNSGTQVTNFTVSENPAKPWETILTFNTVGNYYVTYYSGGDINDSQDINNLYDTMIEKTSQLNRIDFKGNIASMTKDNAVNLVVRVRTKDRDVTSYAKVSWQGSSSLNYPKKNFTLKFYTNNSFNQDKYIDFQNWGANNKFVMKANYIDFTQSRNVVSANIWTDMVSSRKNVPYLMKLSPSLGAIDGFPCELYVNGEYYGIYTFNLPKNDWLAGIPNSNPDQAGIMIDSNWDSADSPTAFRGNPTNFVDQSEYFAVEFPDESILNQDVVDGYFNMFRFVRDSTPEQFKANIENYLNKEALIDYYIFNYVITGTDCLGKNMMMYTYDVGQHWCVTAYDLDSTWGLWWDGGQILSSDYHPVNYNLNNSSLWMKVASCFREELVDRYKELRKTVFSPENLINRFKDYMNEFGSANFERDAERWIHIPSKNRTHLRQLRENVIDRINWMDETFDFASYDDSEVQALSSYEVDFANYRDTEHLRLPWNDEAGVFQVVDGICKPHNFRTHIGNDCVSTIKMTTSNVELESLAELSTGTNNRGFVVRYQDANNYIRLDATGTTFSLYKKVNGVVTQLGTTPYTTTAQKNIKIRCSGNAITVLIDNVQVISATATEFVDNKLFGLVSSHDIAPAPSIYRTFKLTSIS